MFASKAPSIYKELLQNIVSIKNKKNLEDEKIEILPQFINEFSHYQSYVVNRDITRRDKQEAFVGFEEKFQAKRQKGKETS